MSLPSPPVRVSIPAPPFSRLSPVLPIRISLDLLPIRFSILIRISRPEPPVFCISLVTKLTSTAAEPA
ncbi:hypothetical protein CXB77_02015 [Chromatium okenii]|uniref:Uncharacterized protein n=1 Tax=Chromatium okenii TaxID=61644 RepID=A0A2S7XVA6_9GAMM|nr:hypothetical protein CXB77_02015 [Chromatium okenii]